VKTNRQTGRERDGEREIQRQKEIERLVSGVRERDREMPGFLKVFVYYKMSSGTIRHTVYY
jgi:hypothetical protein